MRRLARWLLAATFVAAGGAVAGPACASQEVQGPESSAQSLEPGNSALSDTTRDPNAPRWFDPGIPGEITGSRVNIRGGPSTRFEIAGTARKGQLVQVFTAAGGWYEVSIPQGNVCWVAKRVLTPDQTVTAAAKNRPVPAVVRREIINVRAAGHMRAKVLTRAARGEKLWVVGRLGDWYQIKPPASARAWIHGEFVRLRPELVSRDPEPARFRKGERPAVDPELLALYQRAEAAFLKASTLGPFRGDLADALQHYQQIATDERAPEAMRAHGKRRIAQIVRRMPLSQKRRFYHEQQERFVARMRQIRTRYAGRVVETPPQSFDARGTVYRLSGRKRPATHRLKIGDITLFLLKSKRVDLEAFVGRRVGVIGAVSKAPAGWRGAASEIITVKEIEPLQ